MAGWTGAHMDVCMSGGMHGGGMGRQTDANLFATCIASRKIIRARHQRVNHTEIHAHVAHCLAAHWTCVVVPSVLGKTVTVHEMPTWQLLQHITKTKFE